MKSSLNMWIKISYYLPSTINFQKDLFISTKAQLMEWLQRIYSFYSPKKTSVKNHNKVICILIQFNSCTLACRLNTVI